MLRRTGDGYRHLTLQKLEDRLALSSSVGEIYGTEFMVSSDGFQPQLADSGDRARHPKEKARQAADKADESQLTSFDPRRARFASQWRRPQLSFGETNGSSGFGVGSATPASFGMSAAAVDTVLGQSGNLAPALWLGVQQIPDIEYRSTEHDFNYSSEQVDPDVLDGLITSTRNWTKKPRRTYAADISNTETFLKTDNQYPSHFAPDGHIVANRVANFGNMHSLLLAQKKQSDHFLEGGKYLRQDHHYHISFDVRHPASEISWLRDHKWAIVHQLWGPRESGESARNPPFAIYTSSIDRVPMWVIRSYGDARRTTQSGQYQEMNFVRFPYENINQWHHWDIEYVPNPFGKGLVRAWLDGRLVAEWLNVKNSYFAMIDGSESGPLNPAFGLYSHLAEDGMEAHFDNISVQSNGRYESSISGRVSGPDELRGNIVFATDLETGKKFGVRTGRSGIYTLAVPKGTYSLTAIDKGSGQQKTVASVMTTTKSHIVDIDLPSAPRLQAGVRGRLSSGM